MFPTLQEKLKRYEELELQLQDPEVLADTQKLLDVQKEYGGLSKVALRTRDFNQLEEDCETAKEMFQEETDSAAREYAREELADLTAQYEALREELEDIVLSGDSLTRGSCIMEIRAGAGGDEAALFAAELFSMYRRFAELNGWKFQALGMNETDLGGLKEGSAEVNSRTSTRG